MHQAGTISPFLFGTLSTHLFLSTISVIQLQICSLCCSVPFKMVSIHSEKPICAPSHCVQGLCYPTFPSHLFCFFDYVSSPAHGPHCACKILCFYLDPLHACLCVPVGHLGGGGGGPCARERAVDVPLESIRLVPPCIQPEHL